MFIYKITVMTTNQCYIGLDTKAEYKESRWKMHCKDMRGTSTRKIHIAMREAGLSNCNYEVLARGFSSLSSLAIAEIEYIKEFDSYRTGLNSSPGGDGIGKHDLAVMTTSEIEAIRAALGEHWTEYNRARWAGTTKEERAEMMAHLYAEDVIERRVETQKAYYDTVEGAREKHSAGLKEWAKHNPEKKRANSIKNALKGAEKASKKVTLEKEDGSIETFASRSEMQRRTKQWFSTLLEKTKKGLYYNGYRIKDS